MDFERPDEVNPIRAGVIGSVKAVGVVHGGERINARGICRTPLWGDLVSAVGKELLSCTWKLRD